jgi:hypothetical protein
VIEISLVYLLNRVGYRIAEFFRHWYWNSFFIAGNWLVGRLERLDRFFALRITLKYLFQPLYQDYSLIGYIWGFIFRLLRILVGGLVYASLLSVFLVLYLIWLAAPIFIIYKIFTNAS